MNSFRIPWAKPYLGDEEIGAVNALLRDRRLSMGAEVRAFEDETAALVGRAHAIAVSNGTVALDLAMKLIGVGPGDEVLVSALSYIATTNCIVWQGARPVFCDVDRETLNIDPAEVARRVTPRTKALLAADYAGSPVDYTRLEAICAEHRIALAVDGAQSIGAMHRGRATCSLGTVSTTSFHTAKALLCGEGGMVFCDDPLSPSARAACGGRARSPAASTCTTRWPGTTGSPSSPPRSDARQLDRAGDVLARRAALAARYAERLAALPQVRSTAHLPESIPAWFSYAVRVENRDAVAHSLAEQSVETRSLYPVPAYRQPIPEYRSFADEVRPNAELASAEVLNLPLFYEMTFAEVDEVVDCLGVALAECGAAATPVSIAA